MSLRDLLTFNLFLQFTDGLVSFQAFALGAIEANPVVAAAIVNWGMAWGLDLQQSLGVSVAGPDICAQTQSTLAGDTGIDRDGFGLRVRHHCLSVGNPAIERRTLGPLQLRRTKYRSGSIPAAYKALPQLPKYASAALSKGGNSRRSFP
jgi:hypothetical protein